MADDNSRDIDHRAKNAMRKNLAFKSGIELAQVDKMGLRALALVQLERGATGAPFGDEVLGAHGLIWFLGTERLYLVINNPDG